MQGIDDTRSRVSLWALAATIAVCAACKSSSSPAADAAPANPDAATIVELTIIHTADEHGWLQPFEDTSTNQIYGGVANFKSWLREREGFDATRDLLLSGGDSWTGPAISTWFQGEPVVAAFNALDYHASILGNHEFDFGPEVLDLRVDEAEFSFLAANLQYVDSGQQVDLAEPWVILSANGVQVGVIGLAGTHTPTTAHPERIEDFTFESYADTLAEEIPAIRGAGAQVVVLMAHECADVIVELLETTGADVDLAYAAHCHAQGRSEANGISVISSGANWRAYSVTTISYDTAAAEVIADDSRFVEVVYDGDSANPVTPDAELTSLVATWQEQVDAALSQEVGYTSGGVANGSWEQANWITDTWLWAVPSSEIALSNRGAFRQSIPAGVFTTADVVGVMPFENYLYEVEITGAQLIENIELYLADCAPETYCFMAVSGMTYTDAGESLEVTLASGVPFDQEATYRVLITDFIYHGGGGLLFESQDPTPYDTSVHWRQPVLDWTSSLDTSPSDPLDNYLDYTPRDE